MADLKDQIEKYLKGELTPGEMHALEKMALHDPFLKEALEGGESIPHDDFVADVAALQDRIKQKVRSRSAWVMPLRVAAGVVLLFTASYFIYRVVTPDEPVLLSQKAPEQAAPPAKESVSGDTVSKSTPEKKEQQLLSLNREPVTAQPAHKREKKTGPAAVPPEPTRLAENIVEESKRSDSAGTGAVTAAVPAVKPEPIADELDGKIAGVEVQSTRAKRKIEGEVEKKSSAGDASGFFNLAPQRVITGKVTAADDNTPIPGVNVIIKGTTEGSVSDINGNYRVVTNAGTGDLVFSFIGYEAAEVKLSADKTEINVRLSQDVSQLSEVVVVGYGGPKKDDDAEAPIQLAEPMGGRRAYKKYLDNNLKYPEVALEQKIEGRVTVEFVVQTDGALADFNVIHGLGFGCNEEVIRLVKEGPSWRPSRQADTALESQVRVRVRFKLPK